MKKMKKKTKNNKNEKDNKENVNKLKAEKIKNEILNSDLCTNELIDYSFERGNWNKKLYVPNDIFSS